MVINVLQKFYVTYGSIVNLMEIIFQTCQNCKLLLLLRDNRKKTTKIIVNINKTSLSARILNSKLFNILMINNFQI